MGEKKNFKDKEVFTTYDAARICNANIASIKNWIAKGLLRAFRTPGGHYRIKRRDLELFVQKYNMPYPFGEKVKKVIYLLDGDKKLAQGIKEAVVGHAFSVFRDPLEAVLNIGMERPDVLILDVNSKAFDGVRVLELLNSYPDTRNIQMVVCTRNLSKTREMDLRKKWDIRDFVDKADGEQGLIEALDNLD
jgi:excisionase family DNA binding protein